MCTNCDNNHVYADDLCEFCYVEYSHLYEDDESDNYDYETDRNDYYLPIEEEDYLDVVVDWYPQDE